LKNFKVFRSKVPYLRDVYLAYLIDGAERTDRYGYPIIPPEFCYDKVPDDIAQWDQRFQIKDPAHVAMSFYCKDEKFQPVLNDPKAYVDKLRIYQCLIGMDCSPFDNMPSYIADHQIGMNLAITYYFGKCGLKVIPNVRIANTPGSDESLLAYPKNVLIAIGTNGFTRDLANRDVFMSQVSKVVEVLKPSGIIVYGPASDEVFLTPRFMGTPIYQFNSFMQKRGVSRRKEKKGGECYERQKPPLL